MCLRSMNVYRTSFTLQRVGNLVHDFVDFLFVCLFFSFLQSPKLSLVSLVLVILSSIKNRLSND